MTRRPCTDCDGSGGWLATVRVSGEAYDADQAWITCESCDGLGYADPVCSCCEGSLDDRGWCSSCEEYEGMTTCVGDPLLKRRAA